MHAVSDWRAEAKASWPDNSEVNVIQSVVFCSDLIISTMRTMDNLLVNSKFVPWAAAKSLGSLLHCFAVV